MVVLGWNFEPSIGEAITALNDNRLEVLVIPPDLMDRLKKKGGIDKLRGQVRFSSLQYLTIHPVQRRVQDGEETLSVYLKKDYRGNTANDGDALRVVTQATLSVPAHSGPRKVCVRVVDVFGFEAEVVATVDVAA